MKVGNRRAPETGGHGIHWREGGTRPTHRNSNAWPRHRTWVTMSLKLDRLSELAREDPGRRFHSIAHFLTPKMLYEACFSLRRDASAGVDGITHAEYAYNAHENIRKLHESLRD